MIGCFQIQGRGMGRTLSKKYIKRQYNSWKKKRIQGLALLLSETTLGYKEDSDREAFKRTL